MREYTRIEESFMIMLSGNIKYVPSGICKAVGLLVITRGIYDVRQAA